MPEKVFSTNDVSQKPQRFYSPNLDMFITYDDAYTYMPGVFAGSLVLMNSKTGVVLSDWAGGPPVWNADGKRFAFPQCYKQIFKRRFQRMVLVDTELQTITVYRQKFTRLVLKKFEGDMIYGRDVAAHISIISFDSSVARIRTKNAYKLLELQR